MKKFFITFGSNQLPRFKGNPMSVMLIIEGDSFMDARIKMAENEDLDIQYDFSFQYDMEKAKEMEDRFGMKLYTTKELLKEYR